NPAACGRLGPAVEQRIQQSRSLRHTLPLPAIWLRSAIVSLSAMGTALVASNPVSFARDYCLRIKLAWSPVSEAPRRHERRASAGLTPSPASRLADSVRSLSDGAALSGCGCRGYL